MNPNDPACGNGIHELEAFREYVANRQDYPGREPAAATRSRAVADTAVENTRDSKRARSRDSTSLTRRTITQQPCTFPQRRDYNSALDDESATCIIPRQLNNYKRPDTLVLIHSHQTLDMTPVALRKLHDIRIYAALASLLLSAWCIYIDDVINNDGAFYVRVAGLITQGEWNAAVALYKWPFYPCLIALTGAITGLALEPAAHVLNALLVVLAVVSFITLVEILGGDRKTLVAAAAVVLLYPGLNDYRSFVIRDLGYVAFYLLALVFYFKALSTTHWRLHAGWFTAAVIAALFRIEGFALVLAMLILLRAKHWKRRQLFLKVSIVSAAAFAVMFLAFSWWMVGPTGGIGDTLRASLNNILQPSVERIDALRQAVLPKWSAEHAPVILLMSGVTILTVEVISRLTVINALLAGHAWYRRLLFPLEGAKRLWVGLVVANLSILIAVVAGLFFLTGRYPLALSLTVILAVPFSLCVLYQDWQAMRPAPVLQNWKFPAVAILLVLTALSGVTRFTDKGYLKDGALWIKAHSPPGARLFTNDRIVMHYSARGVFEDIQASGSERTEQLIRSGDWRSYDYLALNVKRRGHHKAAEWRALLGRKPLKLFANERNDQLLIFSTASGPDEQSQTR